MAPQARLWPVMDACRAQLPTVARVVGGGGGGEGGALAVAGDEVGESSPAGAPAVQVAQDQLAALPYSSGTTGMPKGVMLTHRILACNQLQYREASGIGPADAYPIFLPLSHIYGVMLMNAAFGAGAHHILMERFDLDALLQVIQEHQ